MMSQYRFSYRESKGLFNHYWVCYIYDRKTGIEYSGQGNTKRIAKSKAWDEYWSTKDNREAYDNFSPPDKDTLDSTVSPLPSRLPTYRSEAHIQIKIVVAILLGMLITGGVCYWGYDLFKESEHMSSDSIKGGLGPLVGIVAMILGCIGFLFCFFGLFSALFED